MAQKFITTSAQLATNTATGGVLGVSAASIAPAPSSVIVSPTAPKSLLYQRVIVPAGQIYPFVVTGNYVYVEGLAFNSTAADAVPWTPILRTNTNVAGVPLTQSYRSILFPEIFSNVQIDNTGATADLVLTVWIGFGEVRRDAVQNFWSYGAVTATVGAYAANQIVGGQFIFAGAVSPLSQWSMLTKVRFYKTTATVANSDMTLFLFSGSGTFADKTAFAYTPTTPVYLAAINLPAWKTGGAGSTAAYGEVSDLQVSLRGLPLDPNGNRDGTLYGILVANAAYVGTAGEQIGVTLFLQN